MSRQVREAILVLTTEDIEWMVRAHTGITPGSLEVLSAVVLQKAGGPVIELHVSHLAAPLMKEGMELMRVSLKDLERDYRP